jgi:iron complex transport system substrate-binding protein
MPDVRIRVVGALIALLATLTSCSDTTTNAIEITSAMVTSVSSLSEETPRYSKVIALANGSAEIIDSMGFKDILIGRDIASTDESLKSVPIVSTGHQLVAEKIIALQPELVIIDESVGPLDAIQTIRSTGIKVELINEVWSVGEISTKVGAIAELIGTPLAGQSLADEVRLTISESAKAVEGSPRIAFLYLRGGNSIYLLGGKGSGADSLITALGGVDVGAAISNTPFSAFSSEAFTNEDPEILLVMSKGLESVGGVDGLIALPGIAQTRAGKNRAVIAVDDSLLLSFGPRTPNLLIELADAIKQVKR